MAVQVVNFIPSRQAENTQTTQYTSSDVTTIIDKFTVTNTTGAAVTFAVNLVASGGSASSANKVLDKSILAGQTYTCPELVGQVLKDGDFVSTLAGTASALTIRASGREVS